MVAAEPWGGTVRIAFAIVRVVAAAAIIAAVIGQLITSIGYWTGHGYQNIPNSVVNFFSFFTIESNVGTAVVCLIGAVLLAIRKGEDPHWFTILRAVIVTYMAVTGIVYNLLLRNIELPQGVTLEWSNEILHVVGPLYIVLDWLFAPGRTALAWKHIWTIVAFPIVWGVYTLIRGPFTLDELSQKPYWYPYPFLNPNLSQNGYLSVAFYLIMIALTIGAVGAGVIWVSKRKRVAAG
jgi:hypothetical protein